MNDYDLIAPFYDVEHAGFDEDIDLYLHYAEMQTGSLLELACGTGRLLLPLAAQGYTLVGVDSSQPMLDIARRRAQQEGLEARIMLAQQDMRSLNLGRQFSLAFIALGSFAHLVTRKAQQQALVAIRRHVTTGGTFILDISNADIRYMEHLSGQLLHLGTWTLDDGTMLTHLISPASSHSDHMLELTHFYDQHRQGGPVNRTIATSYLALIERTEMELLLEQAGFVVKDIYGGYDLNPFHRESPRMVVIAEAR